MAETVSEASALPYETDPRVARLHEEQRTVWNCTGTVWATYKPSDGRNTLHGMPDPRGVPDIHDTRARVETTLYDGGGWQVVKTAEGGFPPEEISESFLYNLAGGRKYRVCLRYKGDTVRNSYLSFDLRAMGDLKALPQELEERAARGETPRPEPAPTATEADGLLRLGNDPTAALFGSAIASIADPTVKLLVGFALRDADRERQIRLETAARDERFFSVMTGALSRGASGGDGGLTAHLRMEAEAARTRLAKLEAEAEAAREARHKMELAHAQGSSAPHPFAPLLIAAGERVVTAGVVKAVENAGPEGAQKLIAMAAAAAGAGAPAA